MSTANTPTDTPPAANPEAPFAALKEEAQKLLGANASFELSGKLPAFRVSPAELRDACKKLRDQAGFDYLLLMTAVDYPAEKRFELVYVLTNFANGRELGIVTNVDRDNAVAPTVSDIWDTAEWHEREAYDMFGVKFENHPDLRRILLDDSWVGHPLRKDYVDQGHNVIKRPY